MAWKIEISHSAQRNIDRINRQTAHRILRFLHERVAPLDDPRAIGEALHGDILGDHWKYRVGDWRIICRIVDDRVVVTVTKVGHRHEVYR